MALSRQHTFVTGETLTASLLNAEFDNILNNAASLISPLPSGLDLNGQILTIDADADSTLREYSDDVVVFRLQGFDALILDGDVATPVNGITFTSAATGTAPALTAHGETNVAVTLAGKGTGAVQLGQTSSVGVTLVADQAILDSSANEYLKWSKTASAVNEFTVANAATAGRPTLSVTGGDTDIGATLKAKGAGTTIIADGSGNEVIIAGAATSSAVNEITITNAATGTGASIGASGGDSNIDLRLTPKGTGTITSNSAAIARGLIAGLALANNAGDATNDIDVATGVAAAATTYGLMALTSGLTKQLDAVWAVGTNAGMRASGAGIANTTYHIFLIRRPDTGVVDIAADTSATGANVTANTNAAYTQMRRIGSILREAGAIVAFSQAGDEFLRKASVLDVSAANPGASAVTRTLSVPTGIKVWAIFRYNATNASTGVSFMHSFSELDRNDEAPSWTAAPLADTPDSLAAAASVSRANGRLQIRTNTSAQIRSRAFQSDANCTLYIATFGWIDRRGIDD